MTEKMMKISLNMHFEDFKTDSGRINVETVAEIMGSDWFVACPESQVMKKLEDLIALGYEPEVSYMEEGDDFYGKTEVKRSTPGQEWGVKKGAYQSRNGSDS